MKTFVVENAPAAIGPYSHAVRVGNLVFCSGQTPVDPISMKLVGETIEEQTAQVFANMTAVLEGIGLTLQNIAKTTVFLKSMRDFQGMNGVYAAAFNGHKPARSTIAVRENPLDCMVEIECIAEFPSV